MAINVFIFSGRLGRDAELRYTQGGKAVASFAVAVDVGYGDNKSTLWVDCSLWGERGEKLAEYMTKGSMVTVNGEASLQTYQSQGQDKTKLTCRVNDIQLPARGEAKPERQAPQRQAKPQQRDASYSAPDSDDIPFAPFRRKSYY